MNPQAIDNVHVDIKAWLTTEIETDLARYHEASATDSEIRIVFTQAISKAKI